MPIPVKPCDGQFSDELQVVLTRNRNREQWAVYTCPQCGAAVGAVQASGKWVPEQHWPSVTYLPHDPGAKRYDRSTAPQADARHRPGLPSAKFPSSSEQPAELADTQQSR